MWGNLFHDSNEKMSQFSFQTEVNDLLRLDAPINKGPTPRWKRKAAERRSSTSTPLRNSSRLNSSKTPSRTPKSLKRTPGKPKTPSEDRFIPNRSAMNFEASYHKMITAGAENEENECASPSKVEYKKNMAEKLGGNEPNARILAFKNKAPTPREGIRLSENINRQLDETDRCLTVSCSVLRDPFATAFCNLLIKLSRCKTDCTLWNKNCCLKKPCDTQ